MNLITIIACGCLVLLHASRCGQDTDRKALAVLLAWALGVLLGACGISLLLECSGLIPSRPTNRYVKFNVERALQNREQLPKNIIILDGGSYAARAVNYRRLEDGLIKHGYPAMVFQFCQPAAPLFERAYDVKLFSRLVGPEVRKRLNEKNLLLLTEIHRGYDLNPVEQFKNNAHTSRVLAYLQPITVLKALYASWLCQKYDNGVPLTLPVAFELIEHGLLNAFNIGAWHRFEPVAQVQQLEPVFDLNQKKSAYEYKQLNLTNLVRDVSQSGCEKVPLDLRWKQIIDSELTATGLKFKTLHFSTPSRYKDNLRHILQYETKIAGQPFISFQDDYDFLERLDDPECWYDDGHLLRRGSEHCTTWLIGELCESGVLVK